jgi:hypothetical protein
VLKKHLGYFHEDVRLQAVIALQRMFLSHFDFETLNPNCEEVTLHIFCSARAFELGHQSI